MRHAQGWLLISGRDPGNSAASENLSQGFCRRQPAPMAFAHQGAPPSHRCPDGALPIETQLVASAVGRSGPAAQLAGEMSAKSRAVLVSSGEGGASGRGGSRRTGVS